MIYCMYDLHLLYRFRYLSKPRYVGYRCIQTPELQSPIHSYGRNILSKSLVLSRLSRTFVAAGESTVPNSFVRLRWLMFWAPNRNTLTIVRPLTFTGYFFLEVFYVKMYRRTLDVSAIFRQETVHGVERVSYYSITEAKHEPPHNIKNRRNKNCYRKQCCGSGLFLTGSDFRKRPDLDLNKFSSDNFFGGNML
jgi:hypothetical protein